MSETTEGPLPKRSTNDAGNHRVATASGSAPEIGQDIEVEVGPIAAGGGCVGRAPDGRVMFVRHSRPGERVRARVTGDTRSFLRADAVVVLEASPDRVEPPCSYAGPGQCGGCDFQHVAPAAQRRLKADLIAEQLHRLAGVDYPVEVEEVPGDPQGLAWRTRVAFAVDDDGVVGLRRHRSHDVIPVARCPIAVDAVNDSGVINARWPGVRQVEVVASSATGVPVVVVDTGTGRPRDLPEVATGVMWRGRTLQAPSHVTFEVLGHRFTARAGGFWQVHPEAGRVLSEAVLEGLAPQPGERACDLYAGAGLFSAALARAVGPAGSVVAVERSGSAVADLEANVAEFEAELEIIRADIRPDVVARRIGRPDVVVLDPARAGAGIDVMTALVGLDPPPRAVAYVSCEPAPFARDLRVALGSGWSLASLRAFDLFPMTEHVEMVAILQPPG